MSALPPRARKDLDVAIERAVLALAEASKPTTMTEAFEPSDVALQVLLDHVSRMAVASAEIAAAGPLQFGALAALLQRRLRSELVSQAKEFSPHLLINGEIFDDIGGRA